MLRRPVCTAFVFLLSFSLFAQAPKPGLKIDDLNQLVRVGDPKVSPDGKQIVYTVTRVDAEDDKNVSELWMVDWDGSNNLQLTYGTESASSPEWSPDGRYLAFTSSRPGKAKGSQVWVLDRRGGEARQATDVKQDLNDYRWSPDAKQLLLTLREKDEPESDDKNAKPKPPKPIVIDRYHFKQDIEGYLTDKHAQLYLFEIATKKLTKLTSDPGKYEEHEAEWSPDGTMIAFVSNQSQPDPDRVANDDVFVVDAKAGSTPRRLTTFPGEDHGPLAWSPDSKLIAYRQGLSKGYTAYGSTRLAVVPASGGPPELKAMSVDNNVGPPVFTADGKSLLTTVTDDRVVYVEEVPLMGGAPKRVTAEQGVAGALTQSGGHVALLWSTDSADPEIYSMNGGTLHKLTSHNDALLAQRTLATTDDIAAKSKDGTDVHGLLTMPVGYLPGTKAPMLLFIHGGPTAQDEHRFTVDRQLFAAHGFAVLNVNYRGSAGRGRAYSETISDDWGDKEVADLLAVVDAAVATGKIDPERMVVGGWSYGGISTDYLIASTTRFKAASSGAGTANLFGMYGVDEYILQYDNELGPPWKNPETYIKLSYPFFHVERIKTPTLFMGGDKDFNVTLVGGEQMYQALKSVGVPAELIVYPGQFHGFTRPSFIRDRYERWFVWYDKYLGMKRAATGK
ncbi:MAG TPA: S9 family peptidase [Acidobacteriaceae bacterium]|jgi:dipeptidyl aminopeptidase/acylaminoacyl peptidase